MPKLVRQGVGLFYDEMGTGEPPLLLVHGAMNDHTYFAKQIEHFGRRRRTLAVDLRGHGLSDKPEQGSAIPAFADDLLWLCQELSVVRPVVVGHSLGGLIALELAARGQTRAVALLDLPVLPPENLANALKQFVQATQTIQYREAIHQFLSQFVGFTDQPKRRERLIEEMLSGEQQVISSTQRNFADYDAVPALSACKVPILYISAGLWFTEVDRFRKLCPQLITGQTVGSGHYHHLEVPEQINAMVERFVTMATGS